MSSASSRLSKILEHLSFRTDGDTKDSKFIHQLSPTFFLPRAADIEPNAPAIYHLTATGKELRWTYREWADRAKGLGFYIKYEGWKKVGILCPNTPGFLISTFGIGAAGAANVAINYRLKEDDIAYIFDHADVDAIIVDKEYIELLNTFRQSHSKVRIIVDDDSDGESGALADAIRKGLAIDQQQGGHGWRGLWTEVPDERGLIALSYTSGTTDRPKGVEYTHRGAYLAALGNVIESGLGYHSGRCRYLWTLPQFHACGWTFPWAVTAVRGTHYCLRKIDYPIIWKLLKEEGITHFNAAPTVITLLCADKEAAHLAQSVRVTVAASPPTAFLFEQMIKMNLQPVHVYGMTETYGPITKGYHMPEWEEISAAKKYQRMARQGHGFITSLPVRVVKTDLPDGVVENVAKDGQEIGEIVFIGNICARGYYKNPTATRKLFAGGVLHSGDLAIWHPDGAVQILDRAKDIIISGGENISSVALESMLVTHPDVLEAAVVALADEKWGEVPKAYITVRDGGTAVTGPNVINWAKQHSKIPRFMVPREVEVVPELPKTSTGKLRKNVLRDWAKGGRNER